MKQIVNNMSFRKYLNETTQFKDADMGTIECSPGDSMAGVCKICSPHGGEYLRYDEWVAYSDWDLGRPKGHESYMGDNIPFRHKHCGCRWISDSGAEAPSIKSIE